MGARFRFSYADVEKLNFLWVFAYRKPLEDDEMRKTAPHGQLHSGEFIGEPLNLLDRRNWSFKKANIVKLPDGFSSEGKGFWASLGNLYHPTKAVSRYKSTGQTESWGEK